MKSHKSMSQAEFKNYITLLAKETAVRWWQRRNPGCSERAAWKYAERSWRAHADTALEIAARIEAAGEAAAFEGN